MSLDKSDFDTLKDEYVDKKDLIINWAISTLLTRENLRDDYREFIEVSIIFIGGTPSRGIHFMRPGPIHQARWMAKAIYCIKIWIFRSQFQLSHNEGCGFKRIAIFLVKIYLQFWIEAHYAVSAPNNDLRILKILDEYHNEDESVAKVALS